MKKTLASLIVSVLFLPLAVFAAMSSTNYTIYSDAFGVDGGDYASGGQYTLTDTVGEGSGIGDFNTATYLVQGGFQAAVRGTLGINLDTNSVYLGTLSTTTVSAAAVNATVVSTDGGYSLSVTGVSGTMPQAVADGTVTAGTEEYGVAVTGANRAFANDQAVAPGLLLSGSSVPVSADTETLTFKAAINSNSVPGSYSQSVDLTAIANF